MDYFDFQNLFGFGRISQIYIIFLDIYVKQICGIWRRLFEFNKSAFSFPRVLIVIVVSTVPVAAPL